MDYYYRSWFHVFIQDHGKYILLEFLYIFISPIQITIYKGLCVIVLNGTFNTQLQCVEKSIGTIMVLRFITFMETSREFIGMHVSHGIHTFLNQLRDSCKFKMLKKYIHTGLTLIFSDVTSNCRNFVEAFRNWWVQMYNSNVIYCNIYWSIFGKFCHNFDP
jgi:hypothetical protein